MMALFSRLFSPKKTSRKEKFSTSSDQTPFKEQRPFTFSFEKNDIRVLLFRECDWRGRKLLFDSSSVEKVLLEPKTPLQRPQSDSSDMIVEISKGYGYKYKKPGSDITFLGETVFGSIAMASRGPSLKIHSLKEPSRLMFTKIIQAPRAGIKRRRVSEEKTCEDSQGSSMNSMGEFCNSGSFDSRKGSFEATLNDSGIGVGHDSSGKLSSDWLRHLSPQPSSCGSLCPLHPPGLGHSMENEDHVNSSTSLHSNSSLSSLRRRWARSVATTLDFVDNSQPHPISGKRTKLGVAVIVPLVPACAQEMELFLLERSPLINNILTRLQHSTERAYCRRDVFVHSMLQASLNASQSIQELLCGSRMDRPLWLTLTKERSDAATKTELTKKLVSDLSHLLATLDTKHTNFFISTLLTAVLTHHLGWVPTVLNDMPLQQSESLFGDLSKSHPYNPFWAQLSDLQGAIGYPPKIAKTVVVGRSEILVQKLLSILSYFIRCGHVNEENLERELPPDEEGLLEMLLEPDPDKSSFDKDAIREFSQATSFEANISSSNSTLTKSKTVLSMKTFCMTDYELENANSLESGFESCNDFSCDSFEDGNKVAKVLKSSKFKRSSSSAKVLETSFLQKEDDYCNEGDVRLKKSLSLKIVDVVESDFTKISIVESEKQFTAASAFDITKTANSNLSLNGSRQNSFIKENFQSDVREVEEKENKVVFVLGENEELINLKGQDEAKLSEIILDTSQNLKTESSGFEPPLILIDHGDTEDSSLQGEGFETENKTDFISGKISNKVVVVRSTPIDIEESADLKCLRTSQLHRCLSVPEEVVSETDWVKSKRCREAIQVVRKWFSDSAIEQVSHKPLSKSNISENLVCFPKLNCETPASVFRTSNRSLKDTKGGSLEDLVSKVDCDVPCVKVEDVDMPLSLPIDDYVELPSQSSVEPYTCREVRLAASLFGAVSDTYCPELVLQGITHAPPSWSSDLQRSLLLEAHAYELDRDLAEAVCIVANTDTWEVELVSSHSLTVDQTEGGGVGVRVGMSQFVANMLETTQQLCGLSLPAELCLSHVETKLQELCVRSQALAELLLSSDFLDMATLTSVLDLETNDVPLLLSVASAHTPLVTRKYGLSFQ